MTNGKTAQARRFTNLFASSEEGVGRVASLRGCWDEGDGLVVFIAGDDRRRGPILRTGEGPSRMWTQSGIRPEGVTRSSGSAWYRRSGEGDESAVLGLFLTGSVSRTTEVEARTPASFRSWYPNHACRSRSSRGDATSCSRHPLPCGLHAALRDRIRLQQASRAERLRDRRAGELHTVPRRGQLSPASRRGG